MQTLPADDALAVIWRRHTSNILIATAIAEVGKAEQLATSLTNALPVKDSIGFWDHYWRDAPQLDLPDEKLMRFWHLALWKQAGLTTPGGEAATL